MKGRLAKVGVVAVVLVGGACAWVGVWVVRERGVRAGYEAVAVGDTKVRVRELMGKPTEVVGEVRGPVVEYWDDVVVNGESTRVRSEWVYGRWRLVVSARVMVGFDGEGRVVSKHWAD